MTVTYTPENVKTLQHAYDEAVKLEREQFVVLLDGVPLTFVTQYAKYLLEYLKQ